VTSYGLDDGGSIPGRVLGLFPSPPRPGRFWGLPSLLSNGYLGFFSQWVKRSGLEADYSPPSSFEVKNAWSYTSAPPVRLLGVVLS
jgi:hypothetical protein